MRAATEGARCSAREVSALEQRLRASPGDQDARARLLGYVFLRKEGEGAERARFTEHVLWFIANEPTAELVGSGYTALDPTTDRRAFAAAKGLLKAHLRRAPMDRALIGRAADFLRHGDTRASARLYRRAIRLDPAEPRWRENLALQYKLKARAGRGARAAARKALELYEQARRLTHEPTLRFYQLDDLAETALAAGERRKAARYAREALRVAPSFRENWNFGNAIHRGNEVLGRLALQAGRLRSARQYLLAASQTPGSPQLNSFGPSFTLARELLRAGEWEVVAQYLANVARFWTMGGGALEKWRTDVAAQRMPDFDQAFLYLA